MAGSVQEEGRGAGGSSEPEAGARHDVAEMVVTPFTCGV
jgi:hypothetical protein